MTQPHTWFISDIHLNPNTPETTEKFLKFIEKQCYSADALYILGDFFDVWVGDDDLTNYQPIISALATLSHQTPIYLMRGNRDFLMGNKLVQACGAILLPDPCTVTVYNQHILLTHGDALCTDDHAYQRLKRIFSKKWVQRLFLSLPLSLRRLLAQRARRRSQDYTSQQTPSIMDVTQTAITDLLNQHQPTDYLIHGHTHRPAIHPPIPSHPNIPRIVLGSWHKEAQALYWSADHFELQGDEALS